MTSIIKADNISTVSGSGTLSVASGTTLHAPGHVIQVIRDSEGTITPSTSYTTIKELTFTTKGANSHFILMHSGRATIWYLGNGGRQRVEFRFFDTTSSTAIKTYGEVIQLREFSYTGNAMEYCIPFSLQTMYPTSYAAGTSVTLKTELKKIEGNNMNVANNDFIIMEIAQ